MSSQQEAESVKPVDIVAADKKIEQNIEPPKPVEPVTNVKVGEPISWSRLLDCTTIIYLRHFWKVKSHQWKNFDNELADDVTRFKQQYVLSIGDVRVRSVAMTFSAALMYKLISIRRPIGPFRMTRNLGVSFAFMGYWFLPELFNPFLQKPKAIQSIL